MSQLSVTLSDTHNVAGVACDVSKELSLHKLGAIKDFDRVAAEVVMKQVHLDREIII